MLRKRGSVGFIGVLIFFMTTFFLTPVYSASINERDKRLIEIAFMNGFITALQLDKKTAEALLKNKEFLKQYVVTKSKEYLDIVRGLNKN